MQEMDVHTYFGLSYANYLVLHRTLLQSMPEEWQKRFVRMLCELDGAFDHVETPQSFKVQAAEEHELGELDEAQLSALGITRHEVPCTVDHDHDANHGWDCDDTVTYESFERADMERDELVLIPCADPVPHYSRGRARVEPRLPLDPDTLLPSDVTIKR